MIRADVGADQGRELRASFWRQHLKNLGRSELAGGRASDERVCDGRASGLKCALGDRGAVEMSGDRGTLDKVALDTTATPML